MNFVQNRTIILYLNGIFKDVSRINHSDVIRHTPDMNLTI